MTVGLLALAIAAVIIVERLRPLAQQVLDQRARMLPAPSREPVQLPPDLVGLALMDSEEWAQKEMLDGMRALYEECGDWNMVRARYGVAVKA